MASCESSLAGVPLGWGCTHMACQEEGVARSEAGLVARLAQDTMARRSLCHLLNTYYAPGTPHLSLLKAKDVCLTQSE